MAEARRPESSAAEEAILDQRVELSQHDLTTTEVRQAIAPHRLRYILLAGTVAVVLGFVAVYFLVQ